MLFRQIADQRLGQYSYLIGCPTSGEAAVVDPQRDVDRYLAVAEAAGLRITAVAETHVHEDFLAGTRELAARTGARVFLSGEGGRDHGWRDGETTPTLLSDGESFAVGGLDFRALHTPGPTAEHLCFLVRQRTGLDSEGIGVLCGDLLTVGEVGRPMLLPPVGAAASAEAMRLLYRSLWRILELPEYLQLWPAHRPPRLPAAAVTTSTIGYERRNSYPIRLASLGSDVFVATVLEQRPEPLPPYYARLKELNRDGPALLGPLKRPPAATVATLRRLLRGHDALVLDTRSDRSRFLRGHLPGSLYAPLDRRFSTVAASLILPDTPLFLIVEEHDVEDAVRALVRVGLDRVVGYATPAVVAAYAAGGGRLARLPSIGFSQAEKLHQRHDDVQLVDVRRRDEHRKGCLEGALHVPYAQLLPLADELERDRRLVVYSATGARAAVAAAWLARLGYRVAQVEDDLARHLGGATSAAGEAPRRRPVSAFPQPAVELPRAQLASA